MKAIRLSLKAAKALLYRLAGVGERSLREREAVEELRRAVALRTEIRDSLLRERRRDRESKRVAKNNVTAAIREAVQARAGACCESCGGSFSSADPAELDHFFGRGKARQTKTNCWLLHRTCHRSKTNNSPTAIAWLLIFLAHCERWGFTNEARFVRARLDAESLIQKAEGVRNV